MSNWLRKHSGDRAKPIIAVYTCPEHGEFDAEVGRDENGEAPDVIECPVIVHPERTWPVRGPCGCGAFWTPSPVGCRVRRVEAVKGRWERPERPTYLDTRKLGEGQDPEEFQAERKAVWERRRQEDVMAVKKGFE